MDDDDFTPRLGRMRGKDGRRTLKYASRVVLAARLAGSMLGVRSRRFDGSRIGRGAAVGRLLAGRDRFAGLRARRAIVKTRLIRLGASGLSAARAHLHYIQRDGVTREGAAGQLYCADQDQADGKAFLGRCEGDRHQFRFIVAVEDGSEYPDLKPYMRRLMAQMEQDLGTKLDWVAVDHFNTEHPHSHVVLRGVDEHGRNLVVAREYIAHGLRARASELATLDLGPRTTREIEERLRHDVGQERLTAIDRQLLRGADSDNLVSAAHRDPFQQSLRAGRLQMLKSLELAEHVGDGKWRLFDGLDDTLRRMGERGDIIRTMQRELTRQRLERAPVDRIIFDVADARNEPVVGKLITRGLADEHGDRHFVLIDGVDGRSHYVDIGKADVVATMPEGAILRIKVRESSARAVDRTVAEIAQASGGRYSIDLHLRHDPMASEAFARTHVRRLEAMRRVEAGIEREPDGSWRIASDHVARAGVYEQHLRRERPVEVEILSSRPLDQLINADAMTWLDRELASEAPLPLREAGYGREVRSALSARRQWLIEQQLAEGGPAGRGLRAGALAILQRRELFRVASGLEVETAKQFIEVKPGEMIEGVLTRRLELNSGRFAMIENSREFVLVPWAKILESRLGRQIGGIMREGRIDWRLGRGRAGPEIS